MKMAMKKLCADLQSLLSSSLQINSYKRAVEELVYNSLDAKAISIAVRVDIAENKIQVIDNGQGITEMDFDVLGQKYMTSKCVDLNTLKSAPNTYGYRGQSLANIINISQKVKITSRYDDSEDTAVKIFCNGKLRELTKATTRPSVGTTVEIKGLFYNLHIKNKAVDLLGELNDIKLYLKQLSLVHTNISLSLRDDSRNEIIFHVHKNRDIYQTLKLLLDVNISDVQELQVERNTYKAIAYIGKKDKEIRKHHWVYLNKKYLNKSKLHKIINNNLIKSSKKINNSKIKFKVNDNKEDDILANCNIPFYIIILSCPYYDYDISELTSQTIIEFKNWKDITKIIEKLIKFYIGDDISTKQLKPKAINECVNNEMGQIEDTREQVRKIVDKFLKSGTKKIGVSQMQNGVKGKMSKRKFKKGQFNIPISKVIPKSYTTIGPANQHIIARDKTNNEVTPYINVSNINNYSQKCNVNNNPQRENKDIEKCIINDNKGLSLEFKNNATLRVRTKCNNIHLKRNNKAIKKQSKIKIPLSNASSIKSKEGKQFKKKKEVDKSPCLNNRNCDSYINQLQTSLGKEYTYKKNKKYSTNLMNNRKKNSRKISVHENIQYRNIINSSKKISIRKQIEEIIVYDYLPHPLNPSSWDYYKENQYNRSIESNRKTFVCSHDLIKTILKSQYYKTHTRNTNRNAVTYNKNILPCPYAPSKDGNQISNNIFISRLTYESHDYNTKDIAQNVHKHNTTTKFITKHSRDNFQGLLNKQNLKIFSNVKVTSQVKNLVNNKKLKRDFNKGIKTNNYLQESSYFIECSESNDKEKKNKTLNIINLSEYAFNADTILSIDQKKTLDSDELRAEDMLQSKKENTYTTSMYDVENHSIAKIDIHCPKNNKSVNSIYNLESTYTINKNKFDDMNYVSDYIQKERNGINIKQYNAIQSEGDINYVQSNKSFENINPLNVCDTILSNNSTGVVEDELCFNKSVVNLSDSLCNFVFNEPNDDIVKCQYNIHNSVEVPTIQELQQNINASNDILSISKNETLAGIMEEIEEYIRVNTLHEDITTNGDKVFHQEEDSLNNFNMKNRLNFVPKGMSQIFENCNTKNACDRTFNEEYFDNMLYNNFAHKVQFNTKIYQPQIQDVTHVFDLKIEKNNIRRHKENTSLTFDGKSLEQAKVLGQVDGKFIAAIIKAKSETLCYLVLFDQHAVHERIRLENNLSDYLRGNEWNSSSLDNILLKLSKDEILYLHNYKEKFAQFGLKWDIVNNNEVSVNAIPEAILGKNPRQVEKVIQAVKELFQEEINVLKAQRGCISLYPKSIMELVYSEACRYAIKFGDKLTMDDCTDLLHSLSKCKTPFQCAHGRPVMAVMLDITNADNYEFKADISKVHAFHKKQRVEFKN